VVDATMLIPHTLKGGTAINLFVRDMPRLAGAATAPAPCQRAD
jgi:hypothetical protein